MKGLNKCPFTIKQWERVVLDIYFEKSFEKALVVHCGVQLEAVLGIFRGLEGKCKRFFIAAYKISEGQPLDRIIISILNYPAAEFG